MTTLHHSIRPTWDLRIAGLFVVLSAAAGAGTFVGIPAVKQWSASEIIPDAGHAYRVPLRYTWPLVPDSDTSVTPYESETQVWENGRLLGPAHQLHASIRQEGGGKYSHWNHDVYFSASDNTDPRSNGRRYSAKVRLFLSPSLPVVLGICALCVLGGVVYRRTRHAVSWRGIGSWVFVMLGALWFTIRLHGPLFWGSVCVAVIAALWVVHELLNAARSTSGATVYSRRMNDMTLVVASIGLALMAAEAGLAWHERLALVSQGTKSLDQNDLSTHDESHLTSRLGAFSVAVPANILNEAAWRQSLLTMPREWERRPVEQEGAARASLWHAVLHVYDGYGIRRTTEFPAKRADTFRVMVIGDSLTYGDGIEEQYTYSAVLQRQLANEYSIEFLNLGSDGLQSEDLTRRVYEFVPRLRPNLVIYGMCHNDFLPSGVGQYSVNDAFSLPIPDHVKQDLAARSRVVKLVGDGYNALLLKLGFRADFYDDILKDFRNYQGRFGKDMRAMNSFVVSQGLPPVVGIVLDQFPALDSRGYRITQLAEQAFKEAGMEVIDTAEYYRQFSGQNLTVSKWEGHPNEIANSIWAKMIERHLKARDDVSSFKKNLSP
ncbi:MAG TPA: SGNH/GDSL hydrolase family protein [Nitrospira sp.]|nr:SGNH/GDSL hydrolase family protein [Nitrospira sp.]